MNNFLLVSLILVSGCSLIQRRADNVASSVPEKNLPYETPTEAPRKRVLVLPFIDTSGIKGGQGTHTTSAALGARASLISWLNSTERFVVVSPEDFPKDLNQFLSNFQYDLEAIAKIAHGMGIAAVVEGKILEMRGHKIGSSVGVFSKQGVRMEGTIQIRAHAAKNGKEILNVTRDGTAEATTGKGGSTRELMDDPKLVGEVAVKAFKTTVKQLAMAIDKLNWEGRIALIKGDQFYINAGRLSGLQIGDILKATEDSEEVYDPETGAFIGHVPGRMKGTLELVSYFGKDGAIAVLHSGAGITENDRVELY